MIGAVAVGRREYSLIFITFESLGDQMNNVIRWTARIVGSLGALILIGMLFELQGDLRAHPWSSLSFDDQLKLITNGLMAIGLIIA